MKWRWGVAARRRRWFVFSASAIYFFDLSIPSTKILELVLAKFQQPVLVRARLVGGKDVKTNGVRPQFLDEGFQIVFEGEVHGWQQKANGLSFSSRFSSFRVSLEEKDDGRVELLERIMETLKAG